MEQLFRRFPSLTTIDCARIHEYTIDILTNTGVWVEDDAVQDIFKKHGCKTEGKKVFLTEKIIQNAVNDAPEQFTIRAIDPKNNRTFGDDSYTFCPIGGAVTICDIDGSRRNPTMEDVNTFSKLIECIDEIQLNRPTVHPSEVDQVKKFLHTTLSDYKYNNKIYQMRRGTAELVCMAFGITMEKMKEDSDRGIYYGQTTTNPVSPLELSRAATDTILFQAEYGIPNMISPMPIGGISAPVTVEGVVLMQNCENLMAMALSHFINPKAPLFYGTIGLIGDMKKANATGGAPENRVIEAAGAAMARYYKIPSRAAIGTDRVTVDYQTGWEACISITHAIESGLHLISNIGAYACWMQASLAKFVLDSEIIRYANKMIRPLEINEERTAKDLIKKMGSGGAYLMTDHTLHNFRKEVFSSELLTSMTYDKWVKGGCHDIEEMADKKAKKLLDNYTAPDRDPAILKDMEKYVKDNG